MSTQPVSPTTVNNDQAAGLAWYLDKVKELIPAEVSAAFLAINTAIPIDDRNMKYVYGFFALLLVLCALYMRLKTRSVLKWIFVTLVAFPVWALNISVARFEFFTNNTWLPACILFLVTASAPLVALGDTGNSKT